MTTAGQLSVDSGHDLCLYCAECDEDYSASRGDYWDLPDDYEMSCSTCDGPMVLGRWIRTFVEVSG